jgi:hypothetical protein
LRTRRRPVWAPCGVASRRGRETTRGPGAGKVLFLQLGASLGRAGAGFLIAANFAFLFAPLFYFADLGAHVDSRDSSSVAILLLTDPLRVYAIGDLLGLIGAILLAAAVALLLPALWRFDRRPPTDAFVWGWATVLSLAAWAALTVKAQSRARGGIGAVAATGGWSEAALALLVASVLYVVFTVRVDPKGVRSGFAPLRWPVLATFTLFGTASLASTGSKDEWIVTFGLGLTIVLLPLLGIVAYRDVMDGFDRWRWVERVSPVPTPSSLAPDPAEPVPPPPQE